MNRENATHRLTSSLQVTLYRLWHAVRTFDNFCHTTLGKITVLGLSGGLATAGIIATVILALIDPSRNLSTGATVALVFTISWILFTFVLLMGSSVLITKYDDRARAARRQLGEAYVRLNDMREEDADVRYRTDLFGADAVYSADIDSWVTVPLPLSRKTALILAGMGPLDAMKKETRKMTIEDVHIYAALNGLSPANLMTTT